MGNKILVSGSNGFIGRNLMEALKGRGDEAVGIDRELFTDFEKLRKFILKEKPDVIYHLAAFGNHSNQDEPDQIIATNIMGTYILLRAVKGIPLKAFVNFSSSSVYGVKDSPMRETDTLEADTFYGASKIASEYLAKAASKKWDIPTVNVRLFSIFGEGEAEHRLIPTIVRNMVDGTKTTLDPDVPHDWLYIGDVITALFKIVENIDDLKGRVINIGSGQSHTNLEVFEMLKIMSGRLFTDFEKVGSLREYKPIVWKADVELLQRLGWNPTDFSTNLQRTLSYYESLYEPNKK